MSKSLILQIDYGHVVDAGGTRDKAAIGYILVGTVVLNS